MTEQTFGVALTKEEAANLWDLVNAVQSSCAFRDASDMKLVSEIQQRLKIVAEQEPVVLQVTRAEACTLWDLLSAVRCACRFDNFEGWQFVEDFQKRLQQSAVDADVFSPGLFGQ
ncbi:MAG: hypothetical protein WBC04_23820 [Candidatus Acidiferrales bacterium]